MKRILYIFSIAGVMAACNNNPSTGVGDTKLSTAAADTVGLAEFRAWKAQQEMAELYAYRQSIAAPVRKAVTKRPIKYGSATSQSQYPAKAKPKGWSKAAKGAAIGGASGAVIGAVIHKRNRVVGGVVGGVLGAGAGYGIGRTMDKKDGRY